MQFYQMSRNDTLFFKRTIFLKLSEFSNSCQGIENLHREMQVVFLKFIRWSSVPIPNRVVGERKIL